MAELVGPVVFVLPSLAGGGAERVALTFLEATAAAGHACRLLLLDASGPLRPPEAPALTVEVLGQPRLRRALPRLIGRLKALRPAVVVSSQGHLNLALAALAGRLYRPGRLILREANLPSLSLANWPSPALARAGYRRFYRRADRVIATSQRMAAEFRDDFGVPAARLTVLENPVDVAALRRRAEPPEREAGAGRRFVAGGRLVRQKGMDRLVAMWPELPADDHLTILGDGPEREALARAIGRAGLDGRITLTGWRADAARWLAGADAFLMPSRWEGMPNVALEALALGTPVIATPEAGGLPELAAEVPAGGLTVVPVGAAFAHAVAAVRPSSALRSPLLPARFGRAAVAARFLALVEGA